MCSSKKHDIKVTCSLPGCEVVVATYTYATTKYCFVRWNYGIVNEIAVPDSQECPYGFDLARTTYEWDTSTDLSCNEHTEEADADYEAAVEEAEAWQGSARDQYIDYVERELHQSLKPADEVDSSDFGDIDPEIADLGAVYGEDDGLEGYAPS